MIYELIDNKNIEFFPQKKQISNSEEMGMMLAFTHLVQGFENNVGEHSIPYQIIESNYCLFQDSRLYPTDDYILGYITDYDASKYPNFKQLVALNQIYIAESGNVIAICYDIPLEECSENISNLVNDCENYLYYLIRL